MKRFWLSIMAVLLITAAAVPAFAWEFSMTGEYEYRMRYFSRTGTKDMFGDATLQEVPNGVNDGEGGAYIGFAGPNIWRTGYNNTTATIIQDQAATALVAITRGGFSRWNSDAIYSDQRLTFVPGIRVNNAIRVHGTYTVGGIRNKYVQRRTDAAVNISPGAPPFERYYMMDEGLSAYNTGAIGSWEQTRATIQLPLATISIGKKDFVFGNGALYAQNTATDSFFVVVPYGPMRLLTGSYPAHGNGQFAGTNSFDTRPDIGTKYGWRYPFGITYEAGPISIGALYIPMHTHVSAGDSGLTFNQDISDWTGMAFLKYTDGRFFLNFDWWTRDTAVYKIKQTNASGVDPTYAPQYTESYVFWSQAGVLAGPAKISLMYASASGPVQNNYGGVFSNAYRQSKRYGSGFAAVNYQALEQYSFLMFPTYGGGNNTFNADGTGQMSDAFAFAGRLDYAVAANLNLFGSYIWAHRLEKAGTYAGTYFATDLFVPASTVTNTQGRIAQAQAFKGGGATTNPYVDDGLIGWEAQAGFDWKLLEGLNMSFAYSYWRLGEWFDQAYQAFTSQSNSSQAGNTGQGLMQGRDAIHSLRGQFTINF